MQSATDTVPAELLDFVARQSAIPVPPDYVPLVALLRMRYGDALAAVLLYGSCLRDVPIEHGIVDLCAIVKDYRGAHPRIAPRLLNRVLPPNVYYAEAGGSGKALRVKFAVISMADFSRGATRWFHPYIWARFAQPVRLLYTADETLRAGVHEALAGAVLTFLRNCIPAVEQGDMDADALWRTGLSLTYASELRPERDGQAAALVQSDRDYFRQATRCALPALRGCLEAQPGGILRPISAPGERERARRRWKLRRALGRVLSILRLMKAAFTFHGGIDYAAWKIERHAGVRIEITPELRRRPILEGCRVLWRLVKRGALR